MATTDTGPAPRSGAPEVDPGAAAVPIDSRSRSRSRTDGCNPGIGSKDMGHRAGWGWYSDRPRGVVNPVLSMAPVAQALSDELNRDVRFVPDCIGASAERWTRSLPEGGVALLENLRFHAEEEQDDRSFALLLSVHGDLYVNDAPSSSIRRHASIHAIVPLMRAYAGPQLSIHAASIGDVQAAELPGVAALMSKTKVPEKL